MFLKSSSFCNCNKLKSYQWLLISLYSNLTFELKFCSLLSDLLLYFLFWQLFFLLRIYFFIKMFHLCTIFRECYGSILWAFHRIPQDFCKSYGKKIKYSESIIRIFGECRFFRGFHTGYTLIYVYIIVTTKIIRSTPETCYWKNKNYIYATWIVKVSFKQFLK